MTTMKFFHVTAKKNLNSILSNGLNEHSYLINQDHECADDLVGYYCGTVKDEDEEPVVLSVDLLDGDESFISSLEPDYCSIDEPITSALGINEDDVIDLWRDSKKNWMDSLSIVGSCVCGRKIPNSMITLLECEFFESPKITDRGF